MQIQTILDIIEEQDEEIQQIIATRMAATGETEEQILANNKMLAGRLWQVSSIMNAIQLQFEMENNK